MRPALFAAIGECLIELSPRGGGDWRMGVAGDTGNVAFYVRTMLGKDAVAYVTALGDDPFSNRIVAALDNWRISTDRIAVLPGLHPGLYAITLDRAERSFTYWRGESAARHLADDEAWLERALDGVDNLFFSGITLAILQPPARARLLRRLAVRRDAGARIAFDPNYRPALWSSPQKARAAIESACRIADIVLPTFGDEQALFGDAMPEVTAERLERLGAGEVVVKNGALPCLVRAGGRTCEVPALTPERLVDTTGAGDSFNGGYLAARLSGRPAQDAARLGHAVAARVVGAHGAIVEIDPDRALREAGLA